MTLGPAGRNSVEIFFLPRSLSVICYYIILHSDDNLFSWKENRIGIIFGGDVSFVVFPSHKSPFHFSDSGTLCHFLIEGLTQLLRKSP